MAFSSACTDAESCSEAETAVFGGWRAILHIDVKVEKLRPGSERWIKRCPKRDFTRFSRLSATEILVVRPRTAMGALRDWATSKRL